MEREREREREPVTGAPSALWTEGADATQSRMKRVDRRSKES